MPFITMKNTIVQDNSRQITIHHFRPPGSSMDGAASNVVRYQKYVVADWHSGSTIVSLNIGQVAQGSSNCVYILNIHYIYIFDFETSSVDAYPKTVEQIEKAPRDDNIVIECDEQGDNAR